MKSQWLRREWVVAAAATMIVVQLAFRAWAVFGSWFRFDDANFMSYLLSNDLNADVALTGYASHLMPGAFVLTWLNSRAGSLDWAYPATEMLALQALADIGALVFLVSAFGRRAGILAPLALFLFSALSLPASITWGPGITQLPFLAAIFWGGYTHLRYLRTGRFRWAIATMAITVAALLFGEKTLLIFWVYAFLPVAYFATGDLLGRLRSVFVRYRAGVLLYATVVVAYVAWYAAAAMNFGAGDSADQPLMPLIGNLVGTSWSTGVLGGPLRWRFDDNVSAGIAAPGQLVTILALLVLAAFAIELSRHRARSGRAWILLALILFSDVLAIATARLTFAGPDIALLYRYLTETAAVSALALALATMPLLGATEQVERRARVADSALLERPVRVAVAMGVVVLLGLWSSTSYVRHWHDDTRTRDYFTAAERSLDAADGVVKVIDGPVPTWLIWGLAYPDNMVSHVLRPFSDKMTFPSATVDDIAMIADDGTLRPTIIDAVRRNGPGRATGCPFPAEAGSLRVPLDQPVIGVGWWARLTYAASAATPAQVSAGDVRETVELPAGLHSLFVRAEGDRFDDLRIDGLDSGADVCVSQAELGRPRAFVPAPATGSAGGAG